MSLIFEDNRFVTKPFLEKVIDISSKLGINPNWLMWVMNFESGLNPKAQNTTYLINGKPATGLIQFIDSTATSLGTSISDLYQMDNVQQLDYVYKYFKPYIGKINSIYDLYLVTFFPQAIGKPDDWVFESKNISRSSIAQSNPVFDINKDGIITVSELKQIINNRIKPDQHSFIFNTGITLGALITIGILGYAVKKLLFDK